MADSIKKSLARIRGLNPGLSKELSKLPEIARFKTRHSRVALANLVRIYEFLPERFDEMFSCMDRIGLKENRRFCSPLQAFFWMVQDEKMGGTGLLLGLDINRETDQKGDCRPRLESILDNGQNAAGSKNGAFHYSLKKMLDRAWNGEAESGLTPKVYDIIKEIRTRAGAEEYALLAGRRNRMQLQGYIMDDFLTRKEMFHSGDRPVIEKAVAQSRWKLFFSVADRLNSPELINYYINKYFYFRKRPSSGVYFTFKDKGAQCTDAAYFAQFMLKRAGYPTFMRSVKWDEDPWDGLHTGAGIILENGDYLLVSNYTGINAISGPFKGLEALDSKMSCGRKIIDSRWGAYYPPRFY